MRDAAITAPKCSASEQTTAPRLVVHGAYPLAVDSAPPHASLTVESRLPRDKPPHASCTHLNNRFSYRFGNIVARRSCAETPAPNEEFLTTSSQSRSNRRFACTADAAQLSRPQHRKLC